MQFYLEGGRRIGLIAIILACIVSGPLFLLADRPSGNRSHDGGGAYLGQRTILAAVAPTALPA